MKPSKLVIKKIEDIIQTLDYSSLKVYECAVNVFKVTYDYKNQEPLVLPINDCSIVEISKLTNAMASILNQMQADDYHCMVVCTANNRKGNIIKKNDDELVIITNEPKDACIPLELLSFQKETMFTRNYIGSRSSDNQQM